MRFSATKPLVVGGIWLDPYIYPLVNGTDGKDARYDWEAHDERHIMPDLNSPLLAMWEHLARAGNYTYDLQMDRTAGEYNAEFDNYTGMLAELDANRMDLIIGPLVPRPELVQLAYLSVPYDSSRMTLLVSDSRREKRGTVAFFGWVTALPSTFWYIYLAAAMLIAAVGSLYCTAPEKGGHVSWWARFKHLIGSYEAALFAVVEGRIRMYYTACLKSLLLVTPWLATCIVLNVVYGSTLLSALTVPSDVWLVNSFLDFVVDPLYVLVMQKDSVVAQEFGNFPAGTILGDLYRRTQAKNSWATKRELLGLALYERISTARVGLILPNTMIKYKLARFYCTFGSACRRFRIIVPRYGRFQLYIMALAETIPRHERGLMLEEMIWYISTGNMRRMLDKEVANYDRCVIDVSMDYTTNNAVEEDVYTPNLSASWTFKEIQIREMIGNFQLVAMGAILAMLVHLLERIFARGHRKVVQKLNQISSCDRCQARRPCQNFFQQRASARRIHQAYYDQLVVAESLARFGIRRRSFVPNPFIYHPPPQNQV